jgi:hypothetical protein
VQARVEVEQKALSNQKVPGADTSSVGETEGQVHLGEQNRIIAGTSEVTDVRRTFVSL